MEAQITLLNCLIFLEKRKKALTLLPNDYLTGHIRLRAFKFFGINASFFIY